MYRDTTELPATSNCIALINDKALRVYTDSEVVVYQLMGNKYYATDSFDPASPRDQEVCYTLQDVQTLPSQFDFITPIYHLMAILSVLLIFYSAYRLIIYPFFRKKI